MDSLKLLRIEAKNNKNVGNYTIIMDSKIKDANNTVIKGSSSFELEILPKTE